MRIKFALLLGVIALAGIIRADAKIVPGGANSAPSAGVQYVQSVSNYFDSGPYALAINGVVAGHAVIVSAQYCHDAGCPRGDSVDFIGITDVAGSGGTCVPATAHSGGTVVTQAWVCSNATAGNKTLTLTFDSAVRYVSIRATEVSGAGTSALDPGVSNVTFAPAGAGVPIRVYTSSPARWNDFFLAFVRAPFNWPYGTPGWDYLGGCYADADNCTQFDPGSPAGPQDLSFNTWYLQSDFDAMIVAVAEGTSPAMPNLLLGASWASSSNVSLSATTAPGGAAATKVTENTVNGGHLAQQTLTEDGQYSFTVKLAGGSNNRDINVSYGAGGGWCYIMVDMNGGTFPWYGCGDGTWLIQAPTLTALGPGGYQFSVKFFARGGGGSVTLQMRNRAAGADSYTGDNVSNVVFWDASLTRY